MTIEDLPEFGGLQVVSWCVADDEVHIVARPNREDSDCPECGQRSDHLHSHYQRHIRDLPLCQHRLILDLEVRRFRCTNPRAALPTPRPLTWDILKITARGGQLMALCEEHPEFHADLNLLVEGWQIIRERAVQQFDNWMFRLRQSGNPILRNLSLSFYKDRKVIENALLLPYSTSPVEGSINKLKLLKRQMYGRGKLDLLAAKFIRAV